MGRHCNTENEKSAQKNAQKNLACIRRNSLITIAEMSKRTRLSERSVKYYIEQLKQQGLIINSYRSRQGRSLGNNKTKQQLNNMGHRYRADTARRVR